MPASVQGRSSQPKARPRRKPAIELGPTERLAELAAGRESSVTDSVQKLYTALGEPRPAHLEESFRAWRALFAQLGSPDLVSRRARLGRLASKYEFDPDSFCPARLLFALHSYYALILRLIERAADDFYSKTAADPLTVTPIRRNEPSREADLFSWVSQANDAFAPAVGRQLAAVCARVAAHVESFLKAASWREMGGSDLFQPLYEALLPRQARHALGEYYTPAWLAEHVLDELGYAGDPRCRLLDPACGGGVFLLAALRRVCAWQAGRENEPGLSRGEVRRLALANLVGCDLNPLAVLSARVNFSLALLAGLGQDDSADNLPTAVSARGEPSIFRCDSILSPPELGTFDLVAGNPPWVAWDNLPAEYRAASRPLWERYGLFSLNGTAARHGGGKKDLSMLMLYAAADRHLAAGGKLGFVMTQTLLQTAGAGDGFRRFRLGAAGPWLGVLRVNDLVEARPFDAANWTCTIVLEKGVATYYPVPYMRWRRESKTRGAARTAAPRFRREECSARPIDPQRPASPWLIEPAGGLTRESLAVGPSDYAAHLGANTAGANGVFWLRILERRDNLVLVENLPDCGKRKAPRVRQLLEPDLLYPLVRWRDVAPFSISYSAYLLLPQDPNLRAGIPEELLASKYPRTHAYLRQFEPLLRERAAYKRYQGGAPFYSMYDVGPYTLAPHKVVWRRMDKCLRAAVAGVADDPFLGPRPLVPQETCVLVACESAAEAAYLCARLNSDEMNLLAQAHGVRGGKGFGSPAMLNQLGLRKFAPVS